MKLNRKTGDNSLDAISRAPQGQKHGQVLGLLTTLKQICDHPALARKETEDGQGFGRRSAKLQRLDEIVEDVIEAVER